MQFTITSRGADQAVSLGDEIKGVEIKPTRLYEWRLEKVDEVVCRGPRLFASEKEARSQIAQAKKSMKGAGRCKVVTVDAGTSL